MTVHDGKETFGNFYEEFTIGDIFKHWPGRTITEYDDVLHCMQTMNHHPLHIDTNYAENETQFGQNVVVGTLVYSIIFGMTVSEISGKAIANLEIESLKHVAPTFHGDTVYAETTVTDKVESSSRPDRGIVTVATRGYNQRDETVLTFIRKVMVPKRETSN
ncbi:MAG: MaoC family dehydratase [Tepidiformaceae bacterium]|tara:strand:- start:80 stop:562 length:483 start_codon:yes stop_codon:yes gene_type:complete